MYKSANAHSLVLEVKSKFINAECCVTVQPRSLSPQNSNSAIASLCARAYAAAITALAFCDLKKILEKLQADRTYNFVKA